MLGVDVWGEASIGCRAAERGHAGPGLTGQPPQGRKQGTRSTIWWCYFLSTSLAFGKGGCRDDAGRVFLEY